MEPSDADSEWVSLCLGRRPQSRWCVAARDGDGRPSVIENDPFLDDGTPMPTRFWLVDRSLSRRVGTLEAAGGVDRAEVELGLAEIGRIHDAAAAERDQRIGPDHVGPRPSGGVGGTRRGVKCLHAHLAAHLAGVDDAVGRWVARELAEQLDSDADLTATPTRP